MPRSGSTPLENIISVKKNVMDMEKFLIWNSLKWNLDIKDILVPTLVKLKTTKIIAFSQIRIYLIFCIACYL